MIWCHQISGQGAKGELRFSLPLHPEPIARRRTCPRVMARQSGSLLNPLNRVCVEFAMCAASTENPGHAGSSTETPDGSMNDPTGLKSLRPPRGFTGRKPLPYGRARTTSMTIKVSDEDRHRIEQRAIKAGMAPATFVREAALKARVANARPSTAPSLAEMAQITQLNDIALVITREAGKLAKPASLPAATLEAFAKLSRLLDTLMAQAEARDREEAHRQKVAAELAHIGRNLNQITRAVNTMAKRRDGDTALPPYTRTVLADIDRLFAQIPDLKDAGAEDAA